MMEQLLQQMTLKEKVGQLNQRLYGWQVYEKTAAGIFLTDYFKDEVARFGSIGLIYGVFRADPWSEKNLTSGLTVQESQQVSRMIQDYLKEHTRLKIPALLSEECPHGHQGLYATTTPANITAGASWNPALYQELQEIVAEEIREKGAHVGLISTLDIVRDPRWGRTEECFSEDPFMASAFTQAAVGGLQGTEKTIPANKVLAVLKHFAAQGAAMGGHNAGPVAIGERELREIHLPPMIAGIESGALMCMAAYNDLDGIPCHMNHRLLTEILREEAGFAGAVMADGCALDRLAERTHDRALAASLALKSGVDVSLWDNVFPYLEEAVLTGLLDEACLDQAVLRVLKLKEKMGLFTEPNPAVATSTPQKKRALATRLAEEAIVLLKNDGCLPLAAAKPAKIAVIGPHITNSYHQLGDYTPFKEAADCVALLEGLQQQTAGQKISYTAAEGCGIAKVLPNGIEQALAAAKDADQIIVTVGGASTRDFETVFAANGAALTGSGEMTSGENIDLADLSLPACQKELLRALKKLGKPLIGIVIAGRPHLLTELADECNALLFAGYPGQYGGTALARIIFGAVNPSGKLAVSIPDANGQLPVYYNFRDAAFKADYADLPGQPHFGFGFGLSYADFALSAVTVEKQAQTVAIRGKLFNTSRHAGAEVIQVYLKQYSKTVIPRKRALCAFEKIPVPAASSVDFEIVVAAKELLTYDIQLQKTSLTDFQLEVRAGQQKETFAFSDFQQVKSGTQARQIK